MPELVVPTVQLRDSWLAARDDWGPDAHQDGAGLSPADDVDTPQGFSDWVERLHRQSDRSRPVDEGRVHATYWWIVEQGAVVGAIDLRHELNDFLLHAGGHIGYSVRPSSRKQGLATWALGAVLPQARALGMDRVLAHLRRGQRRLGAHHRAQRGSSGGRARHGSGPQASVLDLAPLRSGIAPR